MPAIEMLVPVVGAVVSMLIGSTSISQQLQTHILRKFNAIPPDKTYRERITVLTQSLKEAGEQVDQVISEIASVAQERERAVKELEEKMNALEANEVEIKNRIEHLKSIPLPAINHFAEMMKPSERKSAKRDYILFGAGVFVSTLIAIILKAFGLG